MGLVKDMWMEQQERGYRSIDKTVCSNCVETQTLKDYIAKHGSDCECSYCVETATCVDVDDLIGFIMEGVGSEYEKAVNSMAWDEGEYVGSETWDTCELFQDELYNELCVDDTLLEDIIATVDDDTWCKVDPYQSSESEAHLDMWDQFCSLVKKRMRYVFFRYNPHTSYPEEPAFDILDHIGYAVENMNLLQRIPANHVFYRGRMHQYQSELLTEAQLCSPSHEDAKANRMSAEGISVFYAANDIATTMAEIYKPEFCYATIAEFNNSRELLLLDLTMIDDLVVPSLFDADKRGLREPIKFLLSLNSDLTKPIESKQSIEYIPAQIVTEYFRYLFSHNNESIDGIAYKSSKSKSGICYVLFFDHDQCLPGNPSRLFFMEHTQEIKINPDSICTYNVANEQSFELIAPVEV